MGPCAFLITVLWLTTARGADIEVKKVSARVYYGYTPDSETNVDIFGINSTPFLFYDYGAQSFFLNGKETDGIAELGQQQVTYYRERARGFQARLRVIIREMIRLTNAARIPSKKPQIEIYTEGNYATRQSNILYCYADKFYPYEIEISFLINGKPFAGPVNSLPAADGTDWTFNVFEYIRIEPQDGDIYSCQVDHISLDKPLTVSLDFSTGRPLLTPYSGTIVCAVGVVAGVIGLAITLYLMTKMNNRRGKCCTGRSRQQTTKDGNVTAKGQT